MKTNHLLNTTKKPRVYSAGRCIYCVKCNTTSLTREHVVPKALGGGLIIRDASCAAHQKIINEQIETPILSHFLGPFRQAHGMRQSELSKREIPVEVETGDGAVKTVLISMGEYPELLAMPYTDRLPGLLTGDDPCTVIWEKASFAHNPESINRLAAKLGGSIRLRGSVPSVPFVRFLAKIAHGTAFGHLEEP